MPDRVGARDGKARQFNNVVINQTCTALRSSTGGPIKKVMASPVKSPPVPKNIKKYYPSEIQRIMTRSFLRWMISH
jgi:hypothetical protein